MTQEKNDLDNLLKDSDFKSLPKKGELVEGEVVGIERGEIYLNIDGLFTGIVRGKETASETGEYSNLKIGDKVMATVIETENEKDLLELSFRSAGHQQAWQKINELKNSAQVVEAKVLAANKGGLLLQLDRIQGFLPVSQLSSENYPRVEGGNKRKIFDKLKSFVNKKIKVKILDANEKEDKLIFSEKDVYADERKEKLKQIKIGGEVQGKITAVVDFGVFVEFQIPNSDQKMEGLVHISELAWQRIEHPKDIFKTGDMVKAQIISIDDGRVSLSIKNLEEDPWKKATQKYKIGDEVNGKVLKTDKFGAFVELENNIHGLAHISELSEKQVTSPEEVVEIGKTYKFKIVSLDPEDHRLGLSLKKQEKQEKEKKEN